MEQHPAHHHSDHGYGKYVLIWAALIILTGVTVAVAGINFGALTVATALVIASVKSFLVLTVFMHLKFEQKAFKAFLAAALFFVIISFVLLFADYSFL